MAQAATNETETVTEAAPASEAKPKKAKKARVGAYPFRSKKSILDQIATDDAFAAHCLCIVHDRQTAYEQESKTTKSKNRRGFMSSHAVRGCELAEKLKSGEALTDEETARVREMAGRYGRQLAQHFRAEVIAGNPDLAKVAQVFSAS